MLYFFLFIVLAYVSSVSVNGAYGRWRIASFPESYLRGSRDTTSVHWAWSRSNSVVLAHYESNPIIAKQIRQHREPSFGRALSPLNSLAVSVIVLYQLFPKLVRRHVVVRSCIFTPSCSHFTIGLLRRYGFVKSVVEIKSRLNSCDGREHSDNFKLRSMHAYSEGPNLLATRNSSRLDWDRITGFFVDGRDFRLPHNIAPDPLPDDAELQLASGLRFCEGTTLERSYSSALTCFKRADALGNVYGTYCAALCYLTGKGAPKDVRKAYVLFNRAAAHGVRHAIEERNRLEKGFDPSQLAELQK